MNTTALNRPSPRSYIRDEDKEGEISQDLTYLDEAFAAAEAGDEDTAWAWMAKVDMPESVMYALTFSYGQPFLKSKGFRV